MENACGPIDRSVAVKSEGNRHGPITRLVSPGDIGQMIKPFIFLDHFMMAAGPGGFKGFGWHPHSGIATVTVMLEGAMWYEETTSKGELEAGGVEFFRAASGAWHQGGPKGTDKKEGFQLWIALPESEELQEPDSYYLKASEVKSEGPARIILGHYKNATSPIPTKDINYLDVKLRANETWTYHTPENHTVAFIVVYKGKIACNNRKDSVNRGELVVFNESTESLQFEAIEGDDASFILGSAVKHPYQLHCGSYSVHTSKQSLITGERRIKEIESQLKAQGII
jgi:redox-sensitive bicupin YhaK (pirin superfamily)